LVRLSAFGLRLTFGFDVPFASRDDDGTGHAVTVEQVGDAALEAAWSGDGDLVWETRFGDGSPVTAARGAGGDYLLTYGDHGRFCVSAAGDEILAAPNHPDAAAWQRFMLDTVVWWTALVAGRQLLHAAVVECGDSLVAIFGGTGAGKTTLATELILRGGTLFADDLLCLDDAALAYPGPPLMNVPEARAGATSLGTVIARFDDPEPELWIAASASARRRRPVTHIVVLDRRPGAELALEPIVVTPLDLFASVWEIPGTGDELRRFQTLASLAKESRCYVLRGDTRESPGGLAATLEPILTAHDERRTRDTPSP
jgi:hypothetical protein